MSILRRFWRHERGSSFESVALAMSVIAVFCVAGADLLHYVTKNDSVMVRIVDGLRPRFAQANAPQSLRGGIDYSPTGTIIGLRRAVPLNPCAAAAK